MTGLSMVLSMVLVSAAAPASPLSVKMADYKGWHDSVWVTNGAVELVLVPELGRVMRFGAVGGPNVLWENPALLGQKRPDDYKGWFDVGGDTVWPAEQSQWKSVMKRRWPPDRALDGGVWRVEVLPEKVVRLLSGVSAEYGIKATRVFRLDPERASLVIDQTFEKVSGAPVKCCIWNVTQTDDPELAFLPLNLQTTFPLFYNPIGTLVRDNVNIYDDILQVRRRAVEPTKYGSDSPAGWVACLKKGLLFSEHIAREPGEYPDQGCSAEVFTQEDSVAKMVELETLSPQKVLKVGESLRWRVEWRLNRIPAGLSGLQLAETVRTKLAPPACWADQGRRATPTLRDILY